MSPERLGRLRTAYRQVCEISVGERERFLTQCFPDEPELEEELRHLVRASGEVGSFLAEPLVERIAGLGAETRVYRVGPWVLTGELGHGGSSAVHRARRADDLFDRNVAIKVLSRLSHSEESFQRFQREVQVLARVDHPYIVRLLEADTTPEGVAYIVTELVEGQHLDRFAAGRPLREKLRIFSMVCEGVAEAHRNLVVHRDLKPSNILVTSEGLPKLLDFGIAVLLDGPASRTATGLERMTIHYACPEQLRGEKSVTTGWDVFSLGVLLYELVAEVSPWSLAKQQAPVRLHTDEPAPLKRIPRELQEIVQKAMQADPARRYESVDRLRDDVNRYLEGSPVLAHGDHAAYRLGKLARKHWFVLSAVSAALLPPAPTTTISIASSREAARQSERIKDLLARGLPAVTEDPSHRSSVRSVKLVSETQLNYLTALGTEYPNDLQIAKLRFFAWRTLGAIEGMPATLNLGETENAFRNFDAAVRFGEQILLHWGAKSELADSVATAHVELGTVLLEMNRQQEARLHFDRAGSLTEGSHAQAGLRLQLEVMAQRSRILAYRGSIHEALELRRQVVEARRDLYRKNPKEVQWEYAGGLCSYGELLRVAGQYQEADTEYSEGLPIIESLVRSSGTLENLWHLARENEEYSRVLTARGEESKARDHLIRAIALYRNIESKEPDAASNRRSLAICLSILATQVPPVNAQALIEEAVRLSGQAAAADPDSYRAQTELVEIRERARLIGTRK